MKNKIKKRKHTSFMKKQTKREKAMIWFKSKDQKYGGRTATKYCSKQDEFTKEFEKKRNEPSIRQFYI